MLQLIDPPSPTPYLDNKLFERVVGVISSGDEAAALDACRVGARELEQRAARIFYQHEAEAFELPVARLNQRFWELPLDLISYTAITGDEDLDQTFALDVIANADTVLLNNLTGTLKGPFTELEVRPSPGLPLGEAVLRVTGTWGWPRVVEDSGQTVQDNPLASGATTLTVTATAALAAGMTFRIETEQLVCDSVVDATTCTVQRGVNGTTKASHVQNTTIDIIRYHDKVVEVAGAVAAKLYAARRTGWAPVLSSEGPTEAVAGIWDGRLSELVAQLEKRYDFGH